MSPEFKKLIDDPDCFSEIMKYNCTGLDTTYQTWFDKRGFLMDIINDNGTILDLGCAGGFFLKSLQEWSQFDLVPYGIDVNSEFINAAKKLFPEYANHFQVMNLRNVEQLIEHGLPGQYDFVFASTFDWNENTHIDLIKEKILPLAKKRLILGFYMPNKFTFNSPEWHKERDYMKKGIENLLKSGLTIIGTSINPMKFNHAVAWIDIK